MRALFGDAEIRRKMQLLECWESGSPIDSRPKGTEEWFPDPEPVWDFLHIEYRFGKPLLVRYVFQFADGTVDQAAYGHPNDPHFKYRKCAPEDRRDGDVIPMVELRRGLHRTLYGKPILRLHEFDRLEEPSADAD